MTAPKKRKALSKKTRFEVMKRDKFTCQYCGKQAPDVILHIDHIKPVAKGGVNALTNLVTSCVDCNLGKGARELGDESVVTKQRTEMDHRQERLNQIKLLQEWHLSLVDEKTAEVEALISIIEAQSGFEPNDVGIKKVKTWVKKFSLGVLMESVTAAMSQYYNGDEKSWNRAFNMIPKIAAIKMLPEWRQEAVRMAGAAKKFHYYGHDDQSLFMSIMKALDSKGGCDCGTFKNMYDSTMSLREFCEAIMSEFDLVYGDD